MESNSRDVEAGGLYICLWNMGDAKRAHWGLFVAMNAKRGYVFQCKHGPHTNHKWVFDDKVNYSLGESVTFLSALKISKVDMETKVLAEIISRLKDLPFTESKDSCRAWVMRSIFMLADEGFIGLQPHETLMTKIQDEVNDLIHQSTDGDTPEIVESQYYTP